MSGYEDFEAWVPQPDDEPYPYRGDICTDCGGRWVGTMCETCQLTEQDIADRLTRA